MLLTPNIISIPQVNLGGTGFNDIHISGSRLVLQTDSNGILVGLSYVNNAIFAQSASYAANIPNIYTTTASFNSYTASNNSVVNSLVSATSSYVTNNQTSSMTVLSASHAPNLLPDITDISGSVGIGQNNPLYTLDVNGNIGNSNGNALSLGRFNLLTLGDNPNSDNFNLYFDGSDNGYFKYVAMSLNFLDNGDNSILFLNNSNANGLVGINQSNPQSTLDVSGSINFDGELLNNGSVYVPLNATSASYAPNLFPDITDDKISKCVGINNSNPLTTLDVNGTIANTTETGLTIDSYGNDLNINITNGYNFNLNAFAREPLVINEQSSTWNIESTSSINLATQGNLLFTGNSFGFNTTTPQYTLDVNGEIGNSNGALLLGGITWDHTNGWMGINNDTPAALVEVNQGANPNGTIINDGKPRVLWNVDFNNNPSMELHAGNSNVGTKGSAAYIDFAISDNVDYDSRIIQTSNQFILTSNDSILISGNNCGIQNSNPQFALDVTGDINLSGNLKKNGNVFTASLANTASNLVTTNNYTVNNLNVNGTLNASSISSSTVYITSSNLIITDAYAVINAATPHQQYCGIQFYDSGSTTNRSYLTWDGLNDYLFISSSDGGYQRRLILGPDNNGVLTSGYLPVATGSNGLINSVINQSGTTVGIAGTIQMGNANYSASVIAVSGTQSTFTASCGASAALTQFALKAGNGSGQATIKTSGGGLTIDSAGNISGSSIITAPTFIGSLTGTATTASYVTSASYAPTIIPSQLSVTAITASTALHPIGLTMPYSSSLNALTPLVMTGSHYLYTSASVNLMYVYNGSRWCSSSLA